MGGGDPELEPPSAASLMRQQEAGSEAGVETGLCPRHLIWDVSILNGVLITVPIAALRFL